MFYLPCLADPFTLSEGRFFLASLEAEGAKGPGMVKVRGRQVHRRPGQPVGVGGVVRTFVKVGPPGLARFGVSYGRVRGKQVKGDSGTQEPEYWILDLWAHNLGQRGVPKDPGTV